MNPTFFLLLSRGGVLRDLRSHFAPYRTVHHLPSYLPYRVSWLSNIWPTGGVVYSWGKKPTWFFTFIEVSSLKASSRSDRIFYRNVAAAAPNCRVPFGKKKNTTHVAACRNACLSLREYVRACVLTPLSSGIWAEFHLKKKAVHENRPSSLDSLSSLRPNRPQRQSIGRCLTVLAINPREFLLTRYGFLTPGWLDCLTDWPAGWLYLHFSTIHNIL